MLILTRRVGETVMIGDDVTVTATRPTPVLSAATSTAFWATKKRRSAI